MADRPIDDGSERIELIDRETSRYVGPLGQADFLETVALRAGETIQRNGRPVRAMDAATIRWTGDRAGDAMSDEDRELIVAAVRRLYAADGVPFQIRHVSGEIEDETVARKPGFRSALPHAGSSEGWSLKDEWMSPEYPDPEVYPPTVVYTDASGTAEMPRRIEIRGDRRVRVFVPSQLRWTGARAGDPMSKEEREIITARIRSVYDTWGYAYEIAAG